MRKHNGMRQQDIVILLKITTYKGDSWLLKDLASDLFISPTEVTMSLNRSKIANLIDYNRKKVNRLNLLEFLEHGLRYVFPVYPEGLATGFATAHSHQFMRKHFSSEMKYVWSDREGTERGLIIEPFYQNQTKAIKSDPVLYKMLALVDVLRVGKSREIALAINELKKILLSESRD